MELEQVRAVERTRKAERARERMRLGSESAKLTWQDTLTHTLALQQRRWSRAGQRADDHRRCEEAGPTHGPLPQVRIRLCVCVCLLFLPCFSQPFFSLFEWFNPLYLSDKANNASTREYIHQVLHPQLKDIVNRYKPDVVRRTYSKRAIASPFSLSLFLSSFVF